MKYRQSFLNSICFSCQAAKLYTTKTAHKHVNETINLTLFNEYTFICFAPISRKSRSASNLRSFETLNLKYQGAAFIV